MGDRINISPTTGSVTIANQLVTAGGVSQTGLTSWPTAGASSGLTWGAGPYSNIVDDGDLRICTDDNMHFFCGLTGSSNGTEVLTLTTSAITNRAQSQAAT